jgi:hypothetical protein
VHASGKRWQTQICYGGKQRGLGTFDAKQESALAYDRAVMQRKWERALNFDSTEAGEEAAAEAQAEMFADALRTVCRPVAAEATTSTGLLAQ